MAEVTNQLTLSKGELDLLQTQASNILQSMQSMGVNPLGKFQTFNSLFTLAAIDRSQQNSGNIQRDGIRNIICRSQGDWGDGANKRASTEFGSFDYFIDDVVIASIPAPSDLTSVTFATKITFKVIEPYSMGLFLLTMQQAAQKAGYGLNFKEAPYVFMIEFVGNVNGMPSSPTPGPELTRYIPIKIINIKFNVSASGSTYEVEAIPYNEHVFRDHVIKSVTDIQISGKTVKDILLDGPTSLLAQLETKQLYDQPNVKNSDLIKIQFPKSFMEQVGIDNEIVNSQLYENFQTGGTEPFPYLPDVHLGNKDLYKSTTFKMEDDKTWHFVQEVSIPDIITEVIIRSHYITDQIVGNNFKYDENGMIKWFRIEGRVRDLDNNSQLGRQQRIIEYRVIPYKVHIHRFLPPDVTPPGYDNLKKTVARTYDYIYTGKNTEILKLDLNFDLAFFTPVPADAAEYVGQSTPGLAGLAAGGKKTEQIFPQTTQVDNIGGNSGPFAYQSPSPLVQMQGAGSGGNTLLDLKNQNYNPQLDIKSNQPEIKSASELTANRSFSSKAPGGSGSDNHETSQVRTLQALLTNKGDMVNLNMDIMGDPYYLPSSGMGNIAVPEKTFNILEDGSINYQSGEVDVIINFRTPIDIDLATGLYKFEKTLDMWSGLYQIVQMESRFNGGKFIQNIKGVRRRTQYGGKQSADSIILKESGGSTSSGNESGSGSTDNSGAGSGYNGEGAGSSQSDYGGGGDWNTPVNSYNPNIPNFGGQAAQNTGIPQTPSPSITTDFGRNFTG